MLKRLQLENNCINLEFWVHDLEKKRGEGYDCDFFFDR